MKPLLSVLIITRNEALRLPPLFDSLKPLKIPLEVLVLDSDSQDGTQALARRRGAKVRQVEWKGYSRTKNLGVRQCRAPWILSLDADESLSPRLALAIRDALKAPAGQGYELCRLNHFLGRPVRHGGWYPDWQLRLFRKGTARFNSREVHEGLEMRPGRGETGRLRGDLVHNSYPDLGGYFQRLNRYTSLQARELLRRRGARPVLGLLRLALDPWATFLKMLVLKAGFLDGATGWVLAALSASSTFWKYAKYWHLSWQARGGRADIPWVEKALK